MANRPKRTSRREKRPSFFKIMMDDFTNTLRIPLAFTKLFESKLDTKFILQNPTGIFQFVKVKKIEDNFYFQNGWSNFVENNSLKFGDLLIFTYMGKSKFILKIYDRTCCEKDISSATADKIGNQEKERSRRRKVHVPFDNEPVSFQTEVIPVHSYGEKDKAGCENELSLATLAQTNGNQEEERSRKRKSDVQFDTALMNREIEVISIHSGSESLDMNDLTYSTEDEVESHSFETRFEKDECLVHQDQKESLRLPSKKQHPRSLATAKKRRHAIAQDMRKRAITAKKLKPQSSSDKVVLRPSYINRGFMHFPIRLARCLVQIPDGVRVTRGKLQVRLRVSDGRVWPVMLSCSKGKNYLCRGWNVFVVENNLRIGDTCFFDQIKPGESDLHVTIRHALKQSKPTPAK